MSTSATQKILIQEFSPPMNQVVKDLIEKYLTPLDHSDSISAAMHRRVEDLDAHYRKDGFKLLVALDQNSAAIGCVGIGSLHGLPSSEGVGEIRDLVVEQEQRGKGIGKLLLHRAVEEAKKQGYSRLYLETNTNMEKAKQLFLRTGFRPVTEKTETQGLLPCYFLLEDLDQIKDSYENQA